jgi:hypothetical protein
MVTETPDIVLDFSHGSARDLDFAIVWYAHRIGWDGGSCDIPTLARDWAYYEDGEIPPNYYEEEDFFTLFQDALAFACDDAVEWLNSNCVDDDHYYSIDDNSLFYWRIDEDV